MGTSVSEIINNPLNYEYLMLQTYQKHEGLITVDRMVENLNAKFDVDFATETWSRYTTVLYVVDNFYREDSAEHQVNLEIQRHKAVKQRQDVRNLARKYILEDSIVNAIVERQVIQKYVPVEAKSFNDKDITVFISDIHYTNDPQYLHKFAEDLAEVYGDKRVTLIINGDLVQGTLRISDVYRGSIEVDKQAVDFAFELLSAIEGLNMEKIIVLPGNHDELRLTNHSGSENPSLAKIVSTILDTSVDYDVEYHASYETDDMIVMHGHQFRGKQKCIDWGKTQDKQVIFGHYHQYEQYENVIMLPALCPSDEYAKSLNLHSRMGYVVIDDRGSVQFREVK